MPLLIPRDLPLATCLNCESKAKHGAMQQSDIQIPWIAAGPGIPVNREITSPVSVIQTAPTIAAWLGIQAAECWVGRPVAAVLGGLR